MLPLRVTFSFSTPVVRDSEYPTHLDALLAWCICDEAMSIGHDEPWKIADDLSFLLESESTEKDWVWKASLLKFTPASEKFLMNMIRSCDPLLYLDGFDSGLIKGKRKGINSKSGQERAYQFLTPYQWIEKAEAWCIGDQENIQEILSRLRSIGKMTRNGFGLIEKFSVEPDAAAYDLWKNRVLPSDFNISDPSKYVQGLHCLHPPYWKKTNRFLALEPICGEDFND